MQTHFVNFVSSSACNVIHIHVRSISSIVAFTGRIRAQELAESSPSKDELQPSRSSNLSFFHSTSLPLDPRDGSTVHSRVEPRQHSHSIDRDAAAVPLQQPEKRRDETKWVYNACVPKWEKYAQKGDPTRERHAHGSTELRMSDFFARKVVYEPRMIKSGEWSSENLIHPFGPKLRIMFL